MAQVNETKSTADTLTVNKNLNVDKNLAVTGTITQNGSQVISGVTAAAGSNIGSVGTPSVTASTSNGKTTLTFDYLKGAKGDKGDTGTAGGTGPQGVGISTIKKTSTSGLVDTYTITKTDNSTATFTVTNGAKGDSGTNGTNGTNGVTPTIKASSGANIGSVGTPSVTASTSGTTTTFTFDYLKGAKGDKGDTGSVASVETTGSGNAVTSVTMDANKKVTATKGATFLTSHQTLPTSLKNPNAIKFKNASGTEVSYDGSAAKDLTGGVYYATGTSGLKSLNDSRPSDLNALTWTTENGHGYVQFATGIKGTATNNPSGHDGSLLHLGWDTATAWASEIFASQESNELYIRYNGSEKTGNWSDWAKLVTTSDLSSYLPLSGGTITGNLTVSGDAGFNYSGIGAGSVDAYRVVWFADNTAKGKPVYDNDFTYNPSTNVLKLSSGRIVSDYASGMWITSASNATLTCNYTTYGGIFSAPTKNGRVSLSTYPSSSYGDNNVYLNYFTADQIAAGTNSANNQIYWDAANNVLRTCAIDMRNNSITNLAVGGGVYWNPYVESSTDATDAASITLLSSGSAGGTELKISVANDATDIINLAAPNYIYLNGKRAFDIYDSWLRINEGMGFSSGIYTGSSVVRSDNGFEVHNSADSVTFRANQAGARALSFIPTATNTFSTTENEYSSYQGNPSINTRTNIVTLAKMGTNGANLRLDNLSGANDYYFPQGGGTFAMKSDIPTVPTKTSQLTNDSGFTTNTGTITGIKMNGVSKGTSGVVDLGTVLTAHQDLSSYATKSYVNSQTDNDTIPAFRGTLCRYVGSLSGSSAIWTPISWQGGTYGCVYTITGRTGGTTAWFCVSTSTGASFTNTSAEIVGGAFPYISGAVASFKFIVPAGQTYYVTYNGSWTYVRYTRQPLAAS